MNFRTFQISSINNSCFCSDYNSLFTYYLSSSSRKDIICIFNFNNKCIHGGILNNAGDRMSCGSFLLSGFVFVVAFFVVLGVVFLVVVVFSFWVVITVDFASDALLAANVGTQVTEAIMMTLSAMDKILFMLFLLNVYFGINMFSQIIHDYSFVKSPPFYPINKNFSKILPLFRHARR